MSSLKDKNDMVPKNVRRLEADSWVALGLSQSHGELWIPVKIA